MGSPRDVALRFQGNEPGTPELHHDVCRPNRRGRVDRSRRRRCAGSLMLRHSL